MGLGRNEVARAKGGAVMRTITFKTFARYIHDAAQGYQAAKAQGLEDAARRMAAHARDYIGEYQTTAVGPFPAWPPLAPSTVEDKERQGYAPPDNPLLREGDLRDSIKHSTTRDTAVVGSNSKIAAYQEFGTPTIPPRAFIGRAVAEHGPDEARRIVAQILWPLRRTSGGIRR